MLSPAVLGGRECSSVDSDESELVEKAYVSKGYSEKFQERTNMNVPLSRGQIEIVSRIETTFHVLTVYKMAVPQN